MDIFQKIAEEKIREAIQQGLFDDLPNKGKPLKLEDYSWVPEDLRLAFKILKNAGCIPPEMELRKEIIDLKELLKTIDDDEERIRRIRELNFKLLKFNIGRKRPLYLEDFPEYEDKIIQKFIG
ncbi:DnaJ family domain-containing protein [Thermodesulfovibrio hydrogeniphilus]